MDREASFQVSATSDDGSPAITAEQIDVVLAEVLRVFAVRGRAIRAERGREHGVEPSNTALADAVDVAQYEPETNAIEIEMERGKNAITPTVGES